MKTEKKYEAVYQRMEPLIQHRTKSGQYMGLGFTSNLDYLCRFSTERLNELLERYMPAADLRRMEAHAVIHSMDELLQTIVYYCLHGIGGEAALEDMELVKGVFEQTPGMGGTGVQAAMALAAVGCPSVVHLTDNSEEVCDILAGSCIRTVAASGRLVSPDDMEHTSEQEIHYIIQFKKGDVIRLGGQEEEIPVSNRLILVKMTVNVYVPFSEPYFRYIEEHAEAFTSNVLSSFNEIQDQQLLEEKLAYVKEHTRKYRAANPDGIVFFEDAHYHSDETKKRCMETLYPCVDIVSMNEDELNHTLELYQCDKDICDIIACVEGVKFLQEKFRVKKGMIIHTKDYAMYVGKHIEADIEAGLMYGNMLATTKAANGWYGSRDQIGETMKLALSRDGIEKQACLARSIYQDEVILVPSKYMDKPKYTIGLGDSFVAGVQMCFGSGAENTMK